MYVRVENGGSWLPVRVLTGGATAPEARCWVDHVQWLPSMCNGSHAVDVPYNHIDAVVSPQSMPLQRPRGNARRDAIGGARCRSAVYVVPQLHEALPQYPPPLSLLAGRHSSGVI